MSNDLIRRYVLRSLPIVAALALSSPAAYAWDFQNDDGSFTGQEQDTNCAREVQKAEKAFLKEAKIKLYVSNNHMTDFLNCVQSRQKPITSEIVGGHSAICCHLMNLAYYHGQKLKWDPKERAFAGQTGDARWLTRDYRGPWSV